MKNMKTLLFFIVIFFICFSSLFSQSLDTLWAKTYGGTQKDDSYEVHQTSDGNFIIIGETHSFGASGWNSWLIKINPAGDTIWTKTYRLNWDQGSYSGNQTSDGGFIHAGRIHTNGIDVVIIKTDSIGDTIWTKRYGGSGQEVSIPGGLEIHELSAGGYLVVTNTYSFGAGSSDGWVLKLDSNGDTIWAKTYGGTGEDLFFSGIETSDGNLIFTGWTTSYGAGNHDIYVVKTTSDGSIIWTKTIGNPDVENGFSIKECTDGGYIIAGDITNIGPGYWAALLVKLSSNGDSLWAKTYGDNFDQAAYSVDLIQDNGFILAGRTNTYGNRDLYIVKTDSLGNEVWSGIYGGSGNEIEDPYLGCGISSYYFDKFIVAGNTDSYGAGNCDIWILNFCEPLIIDSTTIWTDTSFAGPFSVNTKIISTWGIDTLLLFYKRIEDPAWSSTIMTAMDGDWYTGSIPQAYVVNDTIKYYIFVQDINSNLKTDPINAPTNYYSFIANIVNSVEEIFVEQIGVLSFSYYLLPNRNILFRFSISETNHVALKIYDMTGRLISTPINRELNPSNYEVEFSPENNGIFFYSIESQSNKESGKFIIF